MVAFSSIWLSLISLFSRFVAYCSIPFSSLFGLDDGGLSKPFVKGKKRWHHKPCTHIHLLLVLGMRGGGARCRAKGALFAN